MNLQVVHLRSITKKAQKKNQPVRGVFTSHRGDFRAGETSPAQNVMPARVTPA